VDRGMFRINPYRYCVYINYGIYLAQ